MSGQEPAVKKRRTHVHMRVAIHASSAEVHVDGIYFGERGLSAFVDAVHNAWRTGRVFMVSGMALFSPAEAGAPAAKSEDGGKPN